mmetsp:Transcript_11127/g.21499  ORF Transcript_11127/g.21499 Transcript_11127/m.21499 type:complete len:124 (-) Transcript_11127:635-1006(-)
MSHAILAQAIHLPPACLQAGARIVDWSTKFRRTNLAEKTLSTTPLRNENFQSALSGFPPFAHISYPNTLRSLQPENVASQNLERDALSSIEADPLLSLRAFLLAVLRVLPLQTLVKCLSNQTV